MRSKNMSSFIVMDIVREAKKFDDCIHFEIGQPDIPPSKRVKDALKKAIEEDRFSYTESFGLFSLREKIAGHYSRRYGIVIDPSRVVLTPGTSGAFLVAYGLSGVKRLGLSDPCYPCYKNFAHFLQIEPVFMPISREDSFELQVERIKQYSFDALQISSPSNPIGNIYSKKNFQEIIEYCSKKGIVFISDELYHGLDFEKFAHSALEFDDEAFVINGFSKFYCMPGNRLGWIIVPKKFIPEAEKIAQNLFISAPTISQYGALEAFDEEFLKGVKEEFKRRRDYLFYELSKIFKVDAKSEGAFYLWVNVSDFCSDSFLFAKELLQNIHIASTPGVDFGKNETHKYIRFAFTRDIDHMKIGIERLKNYLK